MRRLLLALALAQAAGILAADHAWVPPDAALVIGASACALAGPLHGAPRRLAALALVAAFGGGALALGLQLRAADAARPSRRIEATVEATVREVALVGSAAVRLDLEQVSGVGPVPARVPDRIRIWLAPDAESASGLERALPGERIRARVRLAEPASRRNPGAMDAARRARRAGVGAVGTLVHPWLHVRMPEREGARPLAAVHALRARLAERLARLGRGGDVLRALALGQAGALEPAAREACARIGVSHLLSVSGLHLGLVGALAFAGARRGLARSAWLVARCDVRRPALVVAFGAAAAYAVLAGAGIPTRRALVLLLALAAAVALRRPTAAGNSLAAASLAILAWEPQALFDPGAQLSFAGSAALAFASARERRSGRHGVRRALRDGLTVSATALLATAPIAAAHFGRSAPLALAANTMAVPWTGVVLLPGALAAAVLAALPDEGTQRALLAGLGWLGDASLRACELAASMSPELAAGAAPGPLWLAASAALAAAGLRARSPGVRVALAATLAVGLGIVPAAPVEPEGPRVVFLDVGQGDAALVQSRDGTILVDAAGSYGAGFDPGQASVVPALRALGVRRVDLLVVSHGDLDHRGGAPAVVQSLEVGELWLPVGAAGDPAFSGLLEAARSRRVPVVERGSGSPTWVRGALRAAPLWPPRDARAGTRNDRSLVVRVEVEGRRVLFPGDLEADGEAALLAAQVDLRAEVLKLPHHGSRTSSTAPFLSAVDASVAIVSAPCEGRFAMPHRDVVRRARAAGSSLWWTGRDGAVRIGLGRRIHALGTGAPRRCGASG